MKPNIPELLDRLREADEVRTIEAKDCRDGLGKDVTETVSAFSNEPGLSGGYLLFGVAEVAPRVFQVVGVSDPKKIAHDLASRCATDLNRAIRPVLETATVEGRVLVAAFIPEAAPSEKPVFIRAKGMEHGTYRRVGSGDHRCTEDDLRTLFASGTATAYEDAPVGDASEQDLSPDVIGAYRRQLLDENPGSELRDATGMELVQAVGGIRRVAGAWVPTVAGVLLFGTRLALRRLFPQLRVDYVRVPGVRWVPDPDRRYETIDVRDPLLTAFRRVYQAVLDDMPRSFVLQEGTPERLDRPALPEKVVREALVNAITHRDYRAPRPTLVIRYADRLEIHNPGHALVSEAQFGQPGSFPRNPRIADFFREMRLAENKGTGIEAMRRAMRQAQLSPPLFSSDVRGGRFVTTLWLHSLLDEDESRWLDSLGVSHSPAQRQALVIALRTGSVTNAALRDVTGLDPLQSRRELHQLRDANLLRQHGDRALARYVVGDQAAARWTGDPARLLFASPALDLDAAGGGYEGERDFVADADGRDAATPRPGASDPRGRASDLAGGASDPRSRASDLAGGASDLRGRAGDLPGGATDLPGRGSRDGDDPTARVLDEAARAQQQLPLDLTAGPLASQSRLRAAEELGPERARSAEPPLPEHLRAAIAQLGKRARAEQVRTVIVQLCAQAPRGPAELGQLLGREQRVLVRDHLGPMVQEGLLRLERPEQPTDPRQRYVAVIASHDSTDEQEPT